MVLNKTNDITDFAAKGDKEKPAAKVDSDKPGELTAECWELWKKEIKKKEKGQGMMFKHLWIEEKLEDLKKNNRDD